jgi:hypothetical protein
MVRFKLARPSHDDSQNSDHPITLYGRGDVPHVHKEISCFADSEKKL